MEELKKKKEIDENLMYPTELNWRDLQNKISNNDTLWKKKKRVNGTSLSHVQKQLEKFKYFYEL